MKPMELKLCSWRITEDGYYRHRQLVDDWGRITGRITGRVAGSRFTEAYGWTTAAADLTGRSERLGVFTTQTEAESAVERYWKNRSTASADKEQA